MYIKENGILLLLFAKSEGKGKLELGKTFTSGKVHNVKYEDSDLTTLLLDVESSGKNRHVLVKHCDGLLPP